MGKTCFFISRIGDPASPEREFSDKLLKYIIAPVLEKCGYEAPIRADHITQPGVITTQVFTHLWNDDLVIADLTGSNPNVFYELAVRHVRRKPFIHLIERGAKIPFDIAPNRTIEFGFDIEDADRAKVALERMVNASVDDDPAIVQTPLSAAVDFATAGTSSDPVRDGIAQILSLVQEISRRPERVLRTDRPSLESVLLDTTRRAETQLAAVDAAWREIESHAKFLDTVRDPDDEQARAKLQIERKAIQAYRSVAEARVAEARKELEKVEAQYRALSVQP